MRYGMLCIICHELPVFKTLLNNRSYILKQKRIIIRSIREMNTIEKKTFYISR